MNKEPNFDSEETEEVMRQRREFLGDLGKWSGGAALAVVGVAAWISGGGTAQAAGWINRRGGGGWINGGGGWLNGRGGGGGVGWVNGGGGGWVNRRGGGGWINRR